MRDFTLTMLARGESSPYVRGLDVSPIVLIPASERQRRSVFSPPNKSSLAVSPRRLFDDPSDSIQSRLDRPGWDAPMTPPVLPWVEEEWRSRLFTDSIDEEWRVWEQSNPPSSQKSPLGSLSAANYPRTPLREEGLMRHLPPLGYVAPSPYTPHTKMFINGVASSPLRAPEASPDRSTGASPKEPSEASQTNDSAPPSLLPPFTPGESSDIRSSTPPSLDVFKDLGINADPEMDVDNTSTSMLTLGSPAKLSPKPITRQRSLSRATGLNPVAAFQWSPWNDDSDEGHSPARTESVFLSRSGMKMGPESRRRKGGSPTKTAERSRPRSASNAGTSGSGSGKTLMDRVLDNKIARRKHANSQPRIEGEFGVTAMGSPFKLGRKTSRQEFLYSLDGDCEMQDAQPRKRRKTISGRD